MNHSLFNTWSIFYCKSSFEVWLKEHALWKVLKSSTEKQYRETEPSLIGVSKIISIAIWMSFCSKVIHIGFYRSTVVLKILCMLFSFSRSEKDGDGDSDRSESFIAIINSARIAMYHFQFLSRKHFTVSIRSSCFIFLVFPFVRFLSSSYAFSLLCLTCCQSLHDTCTTSTAVASFTFSISSS